MKNPRVADVLRSETEIASVVVMGWVRTKRESKGFVFLEINDGSCLKNLQAIVSEDAPGFEFVDRVNTGAAVRLEGAVVASPGAFGDCRRSRFELSVAEKTTYG